MTTRRKWMFGGVAGGVALVLVAVLYVKVQEARHSVRQTLCVHNLKFISTAMQVYARDNGGSFPNSLSALYPQYLPQLEAYICPELLPDFEKKRDISQPTSSKLEPAEIDSMASYVLVPGLTLSGDKDAVVAYEKTDNHSGKGRSFLYLDGRGAWEPSEKWRDGPPNVNLPPGFRE
ncbi:MAG: hypothetical protein WC655_00925 [Candidatus Hydrogenedentales bacterium]